MQTQHCSQFLHTRQTIPAMLNSNYIGYKAFFIPTECFDKADISTATLQSSSASSEYTQQCFVHAVYGLMKTAEYQLKGQLCSNKAFGWNINGYTS